MTKPVLLLLHLIDLDFAQHDDGPGAPRALETLELTDGYIGEILNTIDQSGLRAATTIAIVSDHGFRPLRTELQPNALFKREGLLTTNEAGRITDWQAYFHSSGGAGFVYLKDPGDAVLRDRVGRLIAQLAADRTNGIEVVWTRDDLDRLGAHPSASFGIGMAEGFYSSTDTDALLKPTRSKGGHGFDPANAEMNAALILSGNAIEPRGNLGIVRMTQIAPTLARMLNVALSAKADAPLWPAAR
jgi:predicted AlkP superfamily pyrophosphatase or phosphodiesterase